MLLWQGLEHALCRLALFTKGCRIRGSVELAACFGNVSFFRGDQAFQIRAQVRVRYRATELLPGSFHVVETEVDQGLMKAKIVARAQFGQSQKRALRLLEVARPTSDIGPCPPHQNGERETITAGENTRKTSVHMTLKPTLNPSIACGFVDGMEKRFGLSFDGACRFPDVFERHGETPRLVMLERFAPPVRSKGGVLGIHRHNDFRTSDCV